MDVIRPVKITDGVLISSNVPENDHGVYNAGTTYANGDRVIVTTGSHRIYESLQNGNINHDPVASPTWWLDVGPTNRWAMFDSVISTQTSNAGSVSIVLQPGGINSLGIMEMEGASVSVELWDGAVRVYERTEDLQIKNAYTFYTHIYEPFAYKKHLIFTDIPNYANGQLHITITGINGGIAKCGVIAVGLSRYLGDLQWQPTAGIIDYSSKITDDFGNTTLVKRAFSKKLSCVLQVESAIIDEVYRILTAIRSEPLAWYGSELYETTIVFGFYKDFSVVIDGYSHSTCNLEIEGLI
jgi:hypothetical protein